MSLESVTERLISADDHVDVSHDLVKEHLASKFHDDYDAGLMRFRGSMASTASVAANEQWRAQQGLAPDPNVGMGKNRRHEANGRPGHSDAGARLADMDDDGVEASVELLRGQLVPLPLPDRGRVEGGDARVQRDVRATSPRPTRSD